MTNGPKPLHNGDPIHEGNTIKNIHDSQDTLKRTTEKVGKENKPLPKNTPIAPVAQEAPSTAYTTDSAGNKHPVKKMYTKATLPKASFSK